MHVSCLLAVVFYNTALLELKNKDLGSTIVNKYVLAVNNLLDITTLKYLNSHGNEALEKNQYFDQS